MVLSTVVGLPILSICPDSGKEFAALLSNSTLYPRENLYLQITRVLVLLD